MSFINSVVYWFFKKRITQIEHFKANPVEVQQELLKRLIQTAKDTEWGKKYDFDSIDNYRIFAERLPIQDYEDIKPYVERLIAGENNILWPEETNWFAKSSGTTSDKSKLSLLPLRHWKIVIIKLAKMFFRSFATTIPTPACLPVKV
jgi:hypothetical protein